MKTNFVLILVMGLCIASTALADFDVDNSCEATLDQPDGETHSVLVHRQAEDLLGENLIVAFQSKPYLEGDPQPASFFIMDKADKDYAKVFDSMITETWNWKFDEQTPYGLVHVHCE